MTTRAVEPTLRDIYAARHRLAPFLRPTPLLHSEWLSSVAKAPVYLKAESLHPTRAFKVRGALNALLNLAGDRGPDWRGLVVTASAGNHGRAIAMAAEQLGHRAIVFTPTSAPHTKKAAIQRHGAELRDKSSQGDRGGNGVFDYDAAEREARAYAASSGAVYVSPYNHADVIAGAGTAALEILETMPTLDVLVVPIGGGGLASGLAIVMKHAAPRVTVVGVEVEASARSLRSPMASSGISSPARSPSISFDVMLTIS